jgi:hypothetical protein
MERRSIVSKWKEAAESGSLLTPRHDPNNLTFVWSSYRSILTQQMSGSLKQFIDSGNYTIKVYSDANYPGGAGLFEVIPDPASGFSVVGSGVPSGSITPSGSLDRLIFVSGIVQGWHVYAESSQQIYSSIAAGRLSLQETL